MVEKLRIWILIFWQFLQQEVLHLLLVRFYDGDDWRNKIITKKLHEKILKNLLCSFFVFCSLWSSRLCFCWTFYTGGCHKMWKNLGLFQQVVKAFCAVCLNSYIKLISFGGSCGIGCRVILFVLEIIISLINQSKIIKKRFLKIQQQKNCLLL